DNQVIFRSFDFNQLPAVLRFAKACVLPSYKEGLGLVVLEALALKIPTVAARTKGITEVITDSGGAGLLFEIGEEQELVNQLIKIFTDDGLVKRLKQNGYKLIKETFNAKRMAVEHVKLYENLIAGKRKMDVLPAHPSTI